MAEAFAELAGPLSTADALPSCALLLVGRDRIDGLVVASPSTKSTVSVIKRESCDEASLRYARALRVLFAASFRSSGDRLRDLEVLFRFEDPWPVWVAMAIFRFDARSEISLAAYEGFGSRRERWLVLALVLAFESPDADTFAHATPAVLVDHFGLDDDEVRSALQVGHPGSNVWDEHLREL